MKTFVPVLALAAGVSATVSFTPTFMVVRSRLHHVLQFNKALPFTCPGNTDNTCTDKQRPGFSWDDLDIGDFFSYKDFNFNNWKCEDESGDWGRYRFAARTGKKVIGGTCSSDKKKSPSFGCGSGVDKFSLGSIHVRPEFDCDLEFHYDMPDGSSCKHRSPCKKSGTTVVNRQCGGAKNVTIVFPQQPNKPKPSCTIKVPTISFECSTKPPKTRTTTKAPTTTKPPVQVTTTSEVKPGSTSTTPADVSSTSVAPGGSSSSAAPVVSSSTVAPGQQTSTSTPPAQGSSTSPAQDSSTSPAQDSSTSPAQDSSTSPAQDSSTSPAQQSSTSPAQQSSTSEAPVTKTITTSYDSISTIFTTSTQTITKCEPTVPSCPANSVSTTVVTIAVSTTICPVTETLTTIETTSVRQTSAGQTSAGQSSASVAVSSSAVVSSSAAVAVTSSTAVAVGGSSTGIVTSVKPVETLPCPGVVPSCMNTFLFNVGCDSNTDTECFCPDAIFVKNVYDCFFAHGQTDAIIAEAVAYFQGICGKWVNENPAIATGATVTSYITVTAAPTIGPVTTVVVDVTKVVPCTDDSGEVIPSSSTTVTISTSMTVPQVGFTTGTTGGVDVIPVTSPPAATSSGSGCVGAGCNGGNGGSGSGTAPAVPTTAKPVVSSPIGTGGLRPTSSIVFAGAGNVGTSLGLAAAAAAFVAVFAL
ncbi:hypothetical protein N0V88_003659 [Collariella sp. IMI 366227]|nr:hypothetical protein N0V88_003659 [Collariella sp. IMI 366227]